MMKRMFMVFLCVALMGIASQAAAAIDYPPTKPIIKVIPAQGNLLKICFNAECTDFNLVAYRIENGTAIGFPRGTGAEPRNGRVYVRLPGQQEQEINSSMIVGNVPTTSTQTGGTIVRVAETQTSSNANGNGTIGSVTVAPATNVPGQFPNNKAFPPPTMFLYFDTGSNEIDPNNKTQMDTLEQKRQELIKNPDATVIFEGTCSIDDKPWTCYVTDDYSYFRQESLYDGRPGVTKLTGAHECNEALAYARAWAPLIWLRNNGVNEYNSFGQRRLYATKFAAYGNRNAYKGINPKLINQSAIAFVLNDNQFVIGPAIPAPGNTVQQKPCPECPTREIRYYVPEGCSIIEDTVGNVTTVRMLCVKDKECPDQSVIPPYQRGDDLGWWLGIGGAGGLGAGFIPTDGDGGDGGDGGSNGGNGENGQNGSAATVCNGDIGCFIGTTVGGMVIGWAGYEIKEACRKAKYERQVKAQQQAQQAQQPAQAKP